MLRDADQADPRLAPGTMVGGFRVMRLLGEGGAGEVYLARDVTLGRKVALKVLRRAGDAFLAEAQVTARFSHPHIVTVHGVGEHDGRPYLALEHVEGETLRARMDADRPGLKESLRIALAIAGAVREAHAHGVLHRDLKPENVLLGKDGRPRVVDFGLAQTGGADDGAARGLEGTPAYMAPEQWRGERCTPATDVWALGVILHELVHGRRPVVASGVAALARAVTAPGPLPELPPPPGVPDAALALLRRCLDKDPAGRPHAREVAGVLELALDPERGRVADDDAGPFRGLAAFGEEHAGFFFGRSAEVLEVLERLREQTVLPIVGLSGAGKSSFIQAGILPRLREQGAWTVIAFRPGGAPIAALARALSSVAGGTGAPGAALRTLETGDAGAAAAAAPASEELLCAELRRRPSALAQVLGAVAEATRTKVLLLVDQMEEVCTHVTDADERRAFLAAVCTAADDRQDPARVCFTVRDDFLGRLAEDCESPEARAALSRVTVLRTPAAPALAEILTRPVELVGYRYESPAIVDDMIAVIRGEQAGLPLLQFAARMLWERRDRERRLLLVAEYQALGGVAGALAEHAESTLAGMTAAESALAQKLLLRLVTPERTRHVVGRARLLEGLPAAAAGVADRLIAARLLASRKGQGDRDGDAAVELAHESLVHRWERFSGWIDEGKEELVFLAELDQAARLWDRRGRPPEEVWRGDTLAAARQRVERLVQEPSGVAAEFLAASEAVERRRRRRRKALWATAFVALLVALAAATGTAMVIADKERVAGRRLAESLREAARAALARGDVFEARARLRSALEREDSLDARALSRGLRDEPLWARRNVGAAVFAVAVTPDGSTAVVSDRSSKIRFLDLTTLEETIVRGLDEPVGTLAPLPGDDEVLLGTTSGRVGVADRRAGTVRYFTPRQGGPVSALVVTGDGARGFSYGGGILRHWDLASGTLIGERRFAGAGAFGWLARSPDDRTLAFNVGDTVRIEDAVTGELRRVIATRGRSTSGAFGPDGAALGFATDAGVVHVHAVATGAPLLEAPGERVRFSHRAAWVALAGDGEVRLVDLATREIRGVLRGAEELGDLAVSSDDRWIVALDGEMGVVVWDARAARPPRALAHDGLFITSALSADGRLIASGGSDGTLVLWSGDDGQPFARLPAGDGPVGAVAVHPDGSRVYSSDGRGVRVWSVATRRTERVLQGEHEWIGRVIASPDGRWIAASDANRSVRVWPAPGDGPAVVLRWSGGARAAGLAFSADGRWLAAGDWDGGIRVFELPSGALVRELAGHRAAVLWLSFSPDGARLASVAFGEDRDVRLWDWRAGESRVIFERREVLPRLFHRDDGTLVLTDLTVELFDASGRHLERLPIWVEAASGLTSDGRWVVFETQVISLETLLPRARAIGLLGASREGLTHQGWFALDASLPSIQPAPARWRDAAAAAANVVEQAGGDLVCVRHGEHEVSGWSRAADRRLFHRRLPEGRHFYWMVAHAEGCVILMGDDSADGTVQLVGPGDTPRTLVEGARALGRDGDGVVVATRTEILRLDRALRVTARYAGVADVSVVERLDDDAVLIGAQGNTAGIARAGRPPRLYFEDVPGEVIQILAGPAGTAIAGTASGHVGIWSLESGRRLDVARMVAPVERIERLGDVLFALAAQGERLVIDLSVYERPYCELLTEVWERVPVVWENGNARRQPPPRGGRCAP
jgi:WD40 repeat protein